MFMSCNCVSDGAVNCAIRWCWDVLGLTRPESLCPADHLVFRLFWQLRVLNDTFLFGRETSWKMLKSLTRIFWVGTPLELLGSDCVENSYWKIRPNVRPHWALNPSGLDTCHWNILEPTGECRITESLPNGRTCPKKAGDGAEDAPNMRIFLGSGYCGQLLWIIMNISVPSLGFYPWAKSKFKYYFKWVHCLCRGLDGQWWD